MCDVKNTEALNIIKSYGSIDGGHHKQWVLDQVVRILTGCPMIEKTGVDCNGKPYTFESYGESKEYKNWVADHNNGDEGPNTYEWSEGVAP